MERAFTDRVVSYPEAVRLFQEGDIWNLRAAELRRLGVAYAYAEGVPTLAPGRVRLEPDAQLDRNPFNNEPFAEPRVLYRVIDDCPAFCALRGRRGTSGPIAEARRDQQLSAGPPHPARDFSERRGIGHVSGSRLRYRKPFGPDDTDV